jgi:hypothetical protein
MSRFINLGKDISSIINKYLINKNDIKSEYKKNVMYLKLTFNDSWGHWYFWKSVGDKPSYFKSHNKWFITMFTWNSKFWELNEEL